MTINMKIETTKNSELGTIYVIDDEEHIRLAIEQMLELQGFNVQTF